MRIGLLHHQRVETIRKRLAPLRIPVFALEPARIQVLAPETADVVYLVPYSELAARGWNGVRVQLARASRQFIVTGHQLGSAEIVAALRDGAADVVDETDADERWQAALTRAVEAQKLWLQLYGGEPLHAEDALAGDSAALRLSLIHI